MPNAEDALRVPPAPEGENLASDHSAGDTTVSQPETDDVFPLEPSVGAAVTEPEPLAPATSGDTAKFDDLTAAVDRLSERLRADQDVIGRMQSRIEALQGDQLRALLGPAVIELANLHSAFVEATARDYERLGLDRVRKEFDVLLDRVESAIGALGAESIGARVGQPFDSRTHQAVKQVPTSDPAFDKTIAGVVRQGFTFDHAGKPALYARVQVHAFDGATCEQPAAPTTDSTPESLSPADAGELELPFPLDPQ